MFRTIAWGVVSGNGTLTVGRGADSTRTGVGTYEITLSSGIEIDNLEMMLTLLPLTAIRGLSFNSGGSTDQVKAVTNFRTDTGANIDGGFYFKIDQLKIL